MTQGEKNEKEKGSIKILSTQVGGDLNDEMKNQLAQVKKLDLCSFYGNQTLASNVDLMGYSSFCVCLVTNGAKDGILVHSDWYHASKVYLLYLSII